MPLARVAVRPPTRPSESAQTIARVLGDSAKLTRRSPVPLQYRHVINWGNPTPLVATNANCRIFNPPAGVVSGINKLTSLLAMQAADARIPEFSTTAPVDARCTWLARGTLTGSAGAGITVVRRGEAFPAAPLYTKYIKKLEEYRIHIGFLKPIFYQQKLRLSNNEQSADQKLIRNHANGWVFAPRPIENLSQDTIDTCVRAVASLGLDFGAVDVVIGKDDGLAYVLEVNTAPGLSSPGLIEAYRNAFSQEIMG